MIARMGTDVGEFKGPEEVHAKFGEPVESGPTFGTFKKDEVVPSDAAFYEDFQTHKKIVDISNYREPGYKNIDLMTLGIIELYLIPCELGSLTKHTLLGQKLRVIYNPQGKVIAAQIDEKWIDFGPKY
jgi:hypothetical protein